MLIFFLNLFNLSRWRKFYEENLSTKQN